MIGDSQDFRNISEQASTCRSNFVGMRPTPVQPFQWKQRPSKQISANE